MVHGDDVEAKEDDVDDFDYIIVLLYFSHPQIRCW